MALMFSDSNEITLVEITCTRYSMNELSKEHFDNLAKTFSHLRVDKTIWTCSR